MTARTDTGRTDKGVRGFELDIHVTFARPLPEAEATRALLALDGFTVDLYRPHPHPTAQRGSVDPAREAEALAQAPGGIPSARLTGVLRDAEATRHGLAALLSGEARYIEIGLRGFLRSATGQTEWMPWRKNVVLPRTAPERVAFESAVRYVLE